MMSSIDAVPDESPQRDTSWFSRRILFSSSVVGANFASRSSAMATMRGLNHQHLHRTRPRCIQRRKGRQVRLSLPGGGRTLVRRSSYYQGIAR